MHDEMQKFTHKFEGAEKQKQGFYNVREKINGLVGFFSDNIRLSLIVDDILPKPIVFKAGKEENQLCIFIKSDGTLYWEWEKRTWKKNFLISSDMYFLQRLFIELHRTSSGYLPHVLLLVVNKVWQVYWSIWMQKCKIKK